MRDAELGAEESAVEIEFDDAPEFFLWRFGYGCVLRRRTAGIVVQNMQAAEAAYGFSERAFNLPALADIAMDEDAIAPGVFAAQAGDSAAAGPVVLSISAMTTRAPSSAKRSAVARPMPVPPPVIKATLLARRTMDSLWAYCHRRFT